MKYMLMLCFVMSGLSLSAHQNCLLAILNKIKRQNNHHTKGGYHTIGESRPILYPSPKVPQINQEEIEIPTLAQDPIAFARYFWGFELSLF